jgi:hypothetical protein
MNASGCTYAALSARHSSCLSRRCNEQRSVTERCFGDIEEVIGVDGVP